MSAMIFKQVLEAVTMNAAAFRCRRTLQPAGGPGTKVFPPTYMGAVYATEQRRIPGREEPVLCVLLDSVQSQANRMEESLQQAIDDGKLKLPLIEVDFSDADLVEPIDKITSLQVPHRIADAILRDSEYQGVKFRQSEVGKTIDAAGPANATPIYKLCPTALIFGMWDSTGPKGGLGMKIERAVVSEVVGFNAQIGIRTASRIDPLITATSSITLYRRGEHGYTLDPEAADKDEKKKPILYGNKKKAGKVSAANLGNVTPTFIDNESKQPMLGGITLEYAEQAITLSLIALRRLRFPINGKVLSEVDAGAQAAVAALGLCAATLAAEKGLDLRSRCLLWPDGPMEWELLAKPGATPEKFTLDGESSIRLLKDAVAHVAKLGLTWVENPVILKPSKSLVDLVRRSQEQSAKGENVEEDVVESKGK
jgi:CRISPR-associated protein Csb1